MWLRNEARNLSNFSPRISVSDLGVKRGGLFSRAARVSIGRRDRPRGSISRGSLNGCTRPVSGERIYAPFAVHETRRRQNILDGDGEPAETEKRRCKVRRRGWLLRNFIGTRPDSNCAPQKNWAGRTVSKRDLKRANYHLSAI